VTSARSLPDKPRQEIEDTLRTLFNRPIRCQFREDADLMAGVRITLGPWQLRANLQDELQGFAELGQEAGND